MELSDGRVTLRTPVEADAPEVAAAVQASLDRLRPWMPWADENYDADTALEWVTGKIDPDAVPLVILGSDGQIVGSTGLNSFDKLNDRANLGYWLRADATGLGYATAATNLVAEYGFQEEGLHRIEIIMSTENEESRRVAERVGADYEGILRGRLWLQGRHHDAHSFSLTADKWSPPDPQ